MKNDPQAPNKRNTLDRRLAISEEVQRTQRVNVADLSRHYGVSEVSIRRDLDYLEQNGLLQRVHGGAQARSLGRQSPLFEARQMQNMERKRAIGQAAAALIEPNDVVMLDSGTTVLEVARHIPRAYLDGSGLTVVTRSLMIATELHQRHQTRLIVLGGVYAHEFDDFVGTQVETALQELHVHTLFMGTDGVIAERGITTDNVMEAGLYRSMVKCADRVVLITDSSKIGVDKLQTILTFNEINVFITDTGAPDEFVRFLRDRDIEVILVPTHE